MAASYPDLSLRTLELALEEFDYAWRVDTDPKNRVVINGPDGILLYAGILDRGYLGAGAILRLCHDAGIQPEDLYAAAVRSAPA